MNYCFFTPDPPALFCLDGGKIYMDNVTLIWAKLTGSFLNTVRHFRNPCEYGRQSLHPPKILVHLGNMEFMNHRTGLLNVLVTITKI